MIKKAHFTLWIILFLDLLLLAISGFELNYKLIFSIRILIYLSGLLLFFVAIRQKGILRAYASLYILSPLVVLLSWLADGILGALIGSIFFTFLALPSDVVIYDNQYQVRTQFSGFLGGCCSYNVYKNKYYLFEEQVGEFRSEYTPSEFTKFEVNSRSQAVICFSGVSPDSTIVKLK